MPARNLVTAKKASESGMPVGFSQALEKSDAELTLSRADEGTTAIASGDHHVAVTKQVSRLLNACKDNPLSKTKYGLEQLRAQGQLTAPEFNSMTEICEAVFAAERGKIDIPAAYEMVRAVYDALLVGEDTSPMALAIASVASGALASNLGATPKTNAPAASRSNGDIGLVGGIAAGGIIGGTIAGVGGAIVGGVIGGIVGGVAGACTRF
jgi:hypothetical protein